MSVLRSVRVTNQDRHSDVGAQLIDILVFANEEAAQNSLLAGLEVDR
jgi:hypothetical protein